MHIKFEEISVWLNMVIKQKPCKSMLACYMCFAKLPTQLQNPVLCHDIHCRG